MTINELIEAYDVLVLEEHEIGLGEVGELWDVLEAGEPLVIPADMTKSGREETITFN